MNIENNLRELGFGDVSVNKKMKELNKVLYDILIKIGSASKTSNLFFLVPPTTAIMAWFVLVEELYRNDLIGLMIASVGVFIATRK